MYGRENWIKIFVEEIIKRFLVDLAKLSVPTQSSM